MGATNHLEAVDHALLRAGRLDKTYEIGLPDESALTGILQHHFGDVPDETLTNVATALAGSVTGADVDRLGREVRRKARRTGRKVDADLLISLALPPDTLPAEERWRVAVHEAGHAVFHATQGHVPLSLSIVTNGIYGGGIRIEGTVRTTPGMVRSHIMMLLGGRVAELAVLGDCSAGAAEDLSQATNLLSVEEVSGMGAWLSVGDVSREAVELRLRRLHADALMLAMRHRADIVALARLAMQRRVLSQSVLATFFKERGL